MDDTHAAQGERCCLTAVLHISHRGSQAHCPNVKRWSFHTKNNEGHWPALAAVSRLLLAGKQCESCSDTAASTKTLPSKPDTPASATTVQSANLQACHLVNGGGQVTVAADTLDIRQVLVALHQGLLVLMPLPLSRQQGAHLHTGLCLQCKCHSHGVDTRAGAPRQDTHSHDRVDTPQAEHTLPRCYLGI